MKEFRKWSIIPINFHLISNYVLNMSLEDMRAFGWSVFCHYQFRLLSQIWIGLFFYLGFMLSSNNVYYTSLDSCNPSLVIKLMFNLILIFIINYFFFNFVKKKLFFLFMRYIFYIFKNFVVFWVKNNFWEILNTFIAYNKKIIIINRKYYFVY